MGLGYPTGRTNGQLYPGGVGTSQKRRHFNHIMKAGGVGQKIEEGGVFSGFAKTIWCIPGVGGDLMWLQCEWVLSSHLLWECPLKLGLVSSSLTPLSPYRPTASLVTLLWLASPQSPTFCPAVSQSLAHCRY